jgi:hypothetical protein
LCADCFADISGATRLRTLFTVSISLGGKNQDFKTVNKIRHYHNQMSFGIFNAMRDNFFNGERAAGVINRKPAMIPGTGGP